MKKSREKTLEAYKREQHEDYYNKINNKIRESRGNDYRIFKAAGLATDYIIAKFRTSFSWGGDGTKLSKPSYDIKGCFDIIILDVDFPSLNFPYPLLRFTRATYQSSILRSCPFTVFFRAGAKDYLWRPRADAYQATYIETKEMIVTVPNGELKEF